MRSLAVGLAALGLCTGAANAQDGRWYVGADVGWADSDFVSNGGGPGFNFVAGTHDLSSEESPHLRVGRHVSDDWRVEVEIARRTSNFEGHCYESGGCTPMGDPGLAFMGEMRRTTLFMNALYEFDPLAGLATPFVGLGAGGAELGIRSPHRGSDRTWAVQAIGGLSIRATDTVTVDLTYRHVRMEDVESYTALGAGGAGQCMGPCPPLPAAPGGMFILFGPAGDAVQTDQIISLGLRYSFGGR